jgi:hypothetical protein
MILCDALSKLTMYCKLSQAPMKSGMTGTIRASPHWNQIDASDNYERYPG